MLIRLIAVIACAIGGASFAQDEPIKPPKPPGGRPPTFPSDIPTSQPLEVVDRVMEAHNARTWRAHSAFTCNITVSFGGQTMLQGSMIVDTNRDRVRFDLNNGTKLIWDGEHAWVAPAEATIEEPRFHLRTWPFFLKAPFELRKSGMNVENLPSVSMEGRVFNAFKLTFDETSKRDTPRDWYIGHSDLGTHTLHSMVYISTWGGKSVAEAEREAHIVFFEDPAILNRVVIPQMWSFYHWREEGGKFGERVGEVKLTDIGFGQIREDTFAKPEGAREVEKPKTDEEDEGERKPEPDDSDE